MSADGQSYFMAGHAAGLAEGLARVQDEKRRDRIAEATTFALIRSGEPIDNPEALACLAYAIADAMVLKGRAYADTARTGGEA